MITFIDAQELHRQFPSTFDAPTQTELDNLKPNDFIKVCAEGGILAERFWIKIIEVNNHNIIGMVDNKLLFYPELPIGLKISVVKSNVYDILVGTPKSS